jgi:hypothetical protein
MSHISVGLGSITKYQSPDNTKQQRFVFSQFLRCELAKWLVPGEDLLPVLMMTAHLRLFCFLYMARGGKNKNKSLFPFHYKDTKFIVLGLYLHDFNYPYSHKDLLSKFSLREGWVFNVGLCEDLNIQFTFLTSFFRIPTMNMEFLSLLTSL